LTVTTTPLWLDLLGYAAAAGTTFSLVPQLVRIWQRRSADDISTAMFSIFSVGVLLWILYGWKLHSRPILIANGITLVLSLAVLGLKIKFSGAPAMPPAEASKVRD
jgi:MtN3 and saliva related transmembrane protein